jgi:hypothetical protein
MRHSCLVLVALILVLAISPSASAAYNRAEYVEVLEATCKPDALATEKAVNGVKADLKAERLRVAAAKFASARQIFSGTIDEIGRVPRPEADFGKLKTWFGYLGLQERYLGKIVRALRSGNVEASQRYTARFVHNGNLANRSVLAFGFDYCSFEFSRYG